MSAHNINQPRALLACFLIIVASATGCPINEPPVGPRVQPRGPPPECAIDNDCVVLLNAPSTCNAAGFCVPTERCADSIACFPLACDSALSTCAACGPNAPCIDGTICRTDGRCRAPGGFQEAPDFEFDIVAVFERGGCVACHNTNSPQEESDLVFDVPSNELYRQLLLFDRQRVVTNAPLASTIITKPLRDDPPDHIIGTWDAESPEVALLVRWISAGAPPLGHCRDVQMSTGAFVDCYDSYRPENYCEDYIANGDESRVRYECPECDERLGTPPDGVTCD